MIAPAVIWMARDTFCQARAARISWLILGVSGLCILLCLSVRVDGPRSLRMPGEIELAGADGRPLDGTEGRTGQLSLAFGGLRVGLFRDVESQVHFLQVLLAKWVAGGAGTLLVVVWTAGFLPEFLQPGSVSVLLAKPVPRRDLLLGKYLGTLAFVAAQAAVFVAGTWAALGLRTGVWGANFLLCLPLLVAQFAIVHAASTLMAAWTRSAGACAFGAIVFWCLCFLMNRGRHLAVAAARLAADPSQHAPPARWAVEVGYWILPKPADLLILLDRALRADAHFGTFPGIDAVIGADAFHPAWSLAASGLFAAALLAAATHEFGRADY